METSLLKVDGLAAPVPVTRVHTMVVGSGAAGLNAALQLHRNGIEDCLILTEGLQKGTSINTGSDKQTYYKLAMCGADADAPRLMAETYTAGGSMHGDLALVEASVSARAFMNLVALGVPFPRDAYGQFVGYKTDHDPRQRATSIGPYTSREMCRALIREVTRAGIPVRSERTGVRLLVTGEGATRRAVGMLALDDQARIEASVANNVVFAVGGPGGLYKASVYPGVHTGAIGLALEAGVGAQNLPESQYGLASTRFRWNVSGTYMQVIPRFLSTAADGQGEPREFLRPYFDSPGTMNSMVFLKGYQWPFDSRKAMGGSSLIDLLVYMETVVLGRRVFLDFRANPADFSFDALSAEARDYLVRSKAGAGTPLERLAAMNPGAIALYGDHGIDLAAEPLEIAVCAQHNNGGLAANAWWESTNTAHLFPVGEVSGTHGVYRPGGSALNSGQVGGFRAAEYIAARYRSDTLDTSPWTAAVVSEAQAVAGWLALCRHAPAGSWQEDRRAIQARMSQAGAHIRSADALGRAVEEARAMWQRLRQQGCHAATATELTEALRNRQLCLAHLVYLEALRFAVTSGVGSRGSAIAVGPGGQHLHPMLDQGWRLIPEDPAFRRKVQETVLVPGDVVVSRWVDCRPIPDSDLWFETAWAAFRSGDVYGR